MKDKIIPLIIRLCNEGRKTIKDAITREWYQLLTSYCQEPAMNSQI